MGPVLRIILVVMVGALAGFVSVQKFVEARGHALAGSTWRTWQVDSSDPYSVAHYFDEGMLPPDAPQWSLYENSKDSSGQSLEADCVYALAGKMPPGRWWRLSAESNGASASAAHHSWLQSDSAVLEADGSIRIAVSPSPRPANWIMPPDINDLKLLLFVLEEQKGAVPAPPQIDRISCP